jgi:hypothetical protein
MASLNYTDWAGGKVWTIKEIAGTIKGTNELEVGEKLTFELDSSIPWAKIQISTYNCGHTSPGSTHDAGEWKGKWCTAGFRIATEVKGQGKARGIFRISSSVRRDAGKDINVLTCEHFPEPTPLSVIMQPCSSPAVAYCWTAEDG